MGTFLLHQHDYMTMKKALNTTMITPTVCTLSQSYAKFVLETTEARQLFLFLFTLGLQAFTKRERVWSHYNC